MSITYTAVDLDAIRHNVRALLQHTRTRLIAVVKANAYGHGAVQVARAALQAGADRLAVARAEEGVELRAAGVRGPILVMSYTPPAFADDLVAWQLTTTINDMESAHALSAHAEAAGRIAPVHIKVDTGMGRFGLLPEEVAPFIDHITALPGLKLEGLFTHFAVADETSAASKAYTRQQLDTFCEVLQAVKTNIQIRHAANSAAALTFPESRLDAVRVGIALYGLRPNAAVQPPVALRPALALKSRVARVRTLPPGASISYGRTYTTRHPTPVALVPAGYGDGCHRLLSNRGAVLIRGQRAPIVGRVCMDQFVVDVTHIPGVQRDDEVVLIGAQGEARITAEEVAGWAETINYEVVTSLLPRAKRVYT